jgi:hypothetical protein
LRYFISLHMLPQALLALTHGGAAVEGRARIVDAAGVRPGAVAFDAGVPCSSRQVSSTAVAQVPTMVALGQMSSPGLPQPRHDSSTAHSRVDRVSPRDGMNPI